MMGQNFLPKSDPESDTDLEEYFRRAEQEFEALCDRSGFCCGSGDGDPCQNLQKDSLGKFFCKDYSNRLGPQKTVSGKVFNCVRITQRMAQGNLPLGCGYRRFHQVLSQK